MSRFIDPLKIKPLTKQTFISTKSNDLKVGKKMEVSKKSSLRGQSVNNKGAPAESNDKNKNYPYGNVGKIQGQMIMNSQPSKTINNLMNNEENNGIKNKDKPLEKQQNINDLAKSTLKTGEEKNMVTYEKTAQVDPLYKSFELQHDDGNLEKADLKLSKSNSNDVNSSDSKFYVNKSSNFPSFAIPSKLVNFAENKKIEEKSNTSLVHKLQRISELNLPIVSRLGRENFVYVRNLGDNQFKALSLFYIEKLIINENIETFIHYLDYFKSENFKIFKISQYLKYFNNEKQIECQKSWDNLITLMENYLDRRLQNKDDNLLRLVYEFYCEFEIDKKNIALAMDLLSRGIMAKAASKEFYPSSFQNFYKLEEKNCTEYDLKLFPIASYYNLKIYLSELYFKEYKSYENSQNNFLNMIKIKDEYYSLYEIHEKIKESIIIYLKHDISLQNEIYEQSYKEKSPIEKNQEYKDLYAKSFLSQFCCLCNHLIDDSNFFMNNCKHIYCLDCIRKRSGNYGLKCFYSSCDYELDAENLLSFISEKDFISDHKQNFEKKKCFVCFQEKEEKEIFTNSKCFHSVCLGCFNEKGSFLCPTLYCPISDCKEYVDRIKFEEFKFSCLQNVEKNLKICDLCKKEENALKLFKNSDCNHHYCISCLEKERSKFCEIKNCKASINQSLIDTFKKSLHASSSISRCYKCQKIEKKESFFSCDRNDFHKFCYKCSQILLEKKKITYSFIECPAQPCFGLFEVKRLTTYLNLNKVNQTENSEQQKLIKDDKVNSISNSIKNEKLNSVQCDKCHHFENKNNCFINPDCNHILCLECSKQKYNKSLPQKFTYSERYYQTSDRHYCDITYCYRRFEFEALQLFLMNANSSLEEKTNKLIECEKQCFKCKKSSKIFVQSGGEVNYYKCEFCKEVMCYIHKFELEKCFCFCKKCLSKTEANPIIPNLRTCVDCKIHFCLICAKDLSNCICYCQMCFELLENEESNLCETCQSQCYICKDEIDKDDLIKIEGCNKQHKTCFKCYFQDSNKNKLKWSKSVKEEEKVCFICKKLNTKNL